ncbi:MAG: hypothetical protein QXE45_04475 [Thermoplasmata archaeon]
MDQETLKRYLKEIVDHFDKEDRAVRERQIRVWRQLKMFWEGVQRIYYSEAARDWRVDESYDDEAQAAYDKPVNVFRAYLESIIAALSMSVPTVIAYPEDAESAVDLQTARAASKLANILYRVNDAPLLWLKALYIYCTEGLVACYHYPLSDHKFGTYKENEYEESAEEQEYFVCPGCQREITDFCPECGEVQPVRKTRLVTTQKIIGIREKPKTRFIIDVFGGLYVKVPVYARKQEDCPYLIFSYETHYAEAIERYPELREQIQAERGKTGAYSVYEQWARLSPQYRSEYPLNNVTIRCAWLRPSAFNVLEEDVCKVLKERFPEGVKVVLINDQVAEANPESLDDRWTLTHNPLADYLHHDPLGLLLVSTQEITNDLISLTIQTIEHGIPQTFANPQVLNFNQYRQSEVIPGGIYPAQPRSGRSLQEDFYEVKTAHLSAEVLPFFERIQQLAQLVSGALPTLFGGALQGTKTASEYSMSRAQALQRLQNTWKMFSSWWQRIFAKVIPEFISYIEDDERDVERDKFGNFINVIIRRAELEGKIGRIELESNELIPVTWGQRRDTILQLLQAPHPKLMEIIASPENIPLLKEALGMPEFHVPGELEREKQYEEISQLLDSQPLVVPTGPDEEQEFPSVDVDEFVDNHALEFQVCKDWLVSDAGRLAKVENPLGYRNVLLHARLHLHYLQQQQQVAGPETSQVRKERKNA